MKPYVKLGGLVFNKDDPDQYEMYLHLKKRTNKSAYLKRLIANDMNNVVNAPRIIPTLDAKDYEPNDSDELMKGML